MWERLFELFQGKMPTEEKPPSVCGGHCGFCLQGYVLRQKQAAGRSWYAASYFCEIARKT